LEVCVVNKMLPDQIIGNYLVIFLRVKSVTSFKMLMWTVSKLAKRNQKVTVRWEKNTKWQWVIRKPHN